MSKLKRAHALCHSKAVPASAQISTASKAGEAQATAIGVFCP